MTSWEEKVKHAMELRGYTQKELSQKSGITEASISRYLSGSRKPRLDVMVCIANALKMSLDYFIEDQRLNNESAAYDALASAIAREGNELTPEQKNQLIELILKVGNNETGR